MFFHFIKLILLAAAVFIGMPVSVLLGLFTTVILGNALIGYYTTIICAVAIIIFAAVESIITVAQMVKMVWK